MFLIVIILLLCFSHYSLSMQSTAHYVFMPTRYNLTIALYMFYTWKTDLCFSLSGKRKNCVHRFSTNGLPFERRAGKYKAGSISFFTQNSRWSKDLNIGKKRNSQINQEILFYKYRVRVYVKYDIKSVIS